MTSPSLILGWVTHSRQTVDLGAIPADTYVLRGHVHVTQAFNSNGTDGVTVGNDVDPDALITSVDVATTGIKSVTLGVNAGFNASAQPVKLFYSNSGSEPSTGAALIILEVSRTPPSPV